jgi:hypothetical protein
MKKQKKRKRPPGAKKKNSLGTQSYNDKLLINTLQKLQAIWPEPRGLNVTEDVIKELDKMMRQRPTKYEIDFNIVRLWFISRQLLSTYLGDTWVNKYDWRQSVKPLGKFGKIEVFESYKYIDRLISIAEIIYNSQKVEGIEHKIQLLKSEDVESALAELEGIQLILSSNRKLKIVTPSGIKGKDYDVEVYLADGTPVACEMKCKLESTDFSEATLRKTITDGAEQLPKDMCGAMFIKLPEIWKATSSFPWRCCINTPTYFL